MRIFEIITEGAIQDPEGWRDVQLNYGDDPKMLDMIKRAAMMPKITSWDQAVDKASAMMQQQTRRKDGQPGKPNREFAVNKRPKRDIPQSDKKRGAQLGNQNARKNFDGTPGINTAKSIGNAIKTIATGSAKDVGNAFAAGQDVGKDLFKDLDNIATTKNPKQTGRVFGT